MHWRIQGGARDAPVGPNSLIFMQFSAKIIDKHTHFGSWRLPSEKSWIRHCIGRSKGSQQPPHENPGSATGVDVSWALGTHLPLFLHFQWWIQGGRLQHPSSVS